MKKRYLLGAALMALTWTSCTQDDSLNLLGDDSVFTGEMEYVGSRTSLGEDNKISWVMEDELSIFKKNTINRHYKVSSINNGKATFTYLDNVTPGTVESIPANYAVYPYSEDNTITSAGVISAPVPATGYTYENRTSFISSALMASTSTGTNFSFKNVQGYLRLRLCAVIPEDYESAVKSVTLTSTKALSGTAEITFGTDGIPTAEIKENAGNSLTVDLKTPQRLATKASGNFVELYVPVVPMTFGAGEITLTINFEEGAPFSKANGKAITIARREVTGMMLEIGADEDFTGDIEGAEEVWDGETVTKPTPVTNEVTGETYYPVGRPSDLAGLAALLNDPTTYASRNATGEINVKLTNNIDLNNKQWIPISYMDNAFTGTFDGNGYTISNLKYHSTEDDWYVGLFGGSKNATFKNLTIENVDINCAKGLHFAALVGDAAGTTVIENVTIKGDVKIEGDVTNVEVGRIGAVVGGNTGNFTLTNVKVEANKGSYVKGNSSIGGIAGQLQGSATFENCSSNIEVVGFKYFAGGIIGLAPKGTTFTNCTTSGDVSIIGGRAGNANDLYRVGGIAGSWGDGVASELTLTNCSYTGTLSGKDLNGTEAVDFDCNGLVGRGYSAIVGAKVIIDGTEYEYCGNGQYAVNGYLMIASGLGFNNTEKEYAIFSAEGLVAMSNTAIKGGEKVVLASDIDLAGVEFTGLSAFNPENNNTFDGQGHTVSNWAYNGGAADMGFIKSWVGTIKNVNFENCHLKTGGRSAVVAGKVYANIENVNVNNSSIEDSYWACGIIAGLYNSGNISNCSVTNSSVKSNGGTAAIAGVINESAGTRKIENCQVEGTTVHNTGVYGEDYSAALFVGMFNADNAIYELNNCTFSNNTVEGGCVANALYYSKAGEGKYIIIDGKIIEHPTGYVQEGDVTSILNAKGMQWFANEVNVNKNAFAGKTVQLAADIDLAGMAWEPIGQTGATTFNGVFDGQNYTISNLNVNSEAQVGAHYSSGLFGWVESHTANHGHLKNVKIEGATIVGHHNCGALVGYITQETALVENCHVTGAKITCTYANADADGDKAGALIGNATVATPVKDCTAKNSTVSSGRDAGQLIGAGREANVTGCSATEVSVSANGTGTGKNVRNEVIGRLL